MTAPALVVLAAGMGSRYGGLKQIDPVGPSGEIVIDYSIHDALAAGFGKLVFVIRPDIETAFREAIGKRYENIVDVRYVFQELDQVPTGFSLPAERQKPWGTCHAVLAAEPAVEEPFAVINADDFYGRESYNILGNFLKMEQQMDLPEYAIVGFVLDHTLSPHGSVARGLCEVDAEGYLQSVEELIKIALDDEGIFNIDPDGSRRPLEGSEYVSMNMWGFPPSFFAPARELFATFLKEQGNQPKSEFFIPETVDALVQNNRALCRVLPSNAQWFGVTYQEDKPEVMARIAKLVEQGTYTSPLS